MPPSLLTSQFATLEPPGADEPGIVRVSIDPPVEAVIAAALGRDCRGAGQRDPPAGTLRGVRPRVLKEDIAMSGFNGARDASSATSPACRRRRPARSVRKIPPARRAGRRWRPRAPAPPRRATSAAAGRYRPRSGIAAGETATIADIEGPGAIQHIWMTPTGTRRFTILRIYWDDSDDPLGRGSGRRLRRGGWGEFAQVSALPICVNPGSAFNSYFEMPFRRQARITIENIADEAMTLYYPGSTR